MSIRYIFVLLRYWTGRTNSASFFCYTELMSQRPIALVTGASSGIGREFARILAANGYDLFVVARRLDRLTALADELKQKHGTMVWTLQMDLRQADTPERILQEVEKVGRPIEVLINDAGLGHAGTFADMPWNEIEEQMKVNMFALANLTRLVLPKMLARKQGRILNVGSVAGYLPGPGMAIYYATKAFVISLTEALWQETQGTGVTVTCLCPGLTRSEFHQVAHMKSGKLGWMSAESVAAIGYRAMMKGQRIVNAGGINSFFAGVVRFIPHRWLLLAGKINRR